MGRGPGSHRRQPGAVHRPGGHLPAPAATHTLDRPRPPGGDRHPGLHRARGAAGQPGHELCPLQHHRAHGAHALRSHREAVFREAGAYSVRGASAGEAEALPGRVPAVQGGQHRRPLEGRGFRLRAVGPGDDHEQRGLWRQRGSRVVGSDPCHWYAREVVYSQRRGAAPAGQDPRPGRLRHRRAGLVPQHHGGGEGAEAGDCEQGPHQLIPAGVVQRAEDPPPHPPPQHRLLVRGVH
mmetsp:Transcript_32975/g.92667  ORF Transcript_32975/g.92667 Transcript_32975/m.92667 type:complete len:237 (+) Transcript_32975:462-1172(+)